MCILLLLRITPADARMEEFNLPPSRRLLHTQQEQKVTTENGPGKKMLKRYERSRYVYENKENRDIMPAEKSDIDVEMTWILQKMTGLWGTNCPEWRFGERYLAAFLASVLTS